MPTHLKHTIKSIYLENGLFSFLFFFIPLIPGFIEHRTHSYLKLIETLTGTPDQAEIEPAIKTIFGTRGVKSLTQFTQNKVTPVSAGKIEKAFIVSRNPDLGFTLLEDLFLNPLQRQYALSDLHRTKAINLLSTIFHTYSEPDHQIVRSLYIQKIAALARVEQAIDPKHAIIDQFTQILRVTANTERLVLENKAKSEMNLLAAKIKAELVGNATAGDPQFSFFTEDPIKVNHNVTKDDLNLMVSTLHHLKEAKTPEIALAAHTKLRQISPLPSSLTV
jgi:hypothetical protein